MDDNTALLWYLLSKIAQWATNPHQRMDGTITVAAMMEYAKAQPPTSNTNVPLYLAHDLVQALASPDRRGLTDTLKDILIKIGEAPPSKADFYQAIGIMNQRITNGDGDQAAFERAIKTVRRYLNRPL
jgi:hypothetical protein